MYEDYELDGPYLNKGRLRLIMTHKITKEKHIISYPKYLMECHLGRYLEKDETVDHIDGNPLNNEITNLRVIPRKIHCSRDAKRNKDVKVNCRYCGKEFIIPGSKLNDRNRKDKHQSGYFCSRQCSGKYGRDIQLKRIEHKICERIKPIQYTQHDTPYSGAT